MSKVSNALQGHYLRTLATDMVHQRIHEGAFFTTSLADPVLGAAASLRLLIQVPVAEGVHVRIHGSAGGEATVELFENTTFSIAGAAVSMNNRNRFSASVSPITVTSGPTITLPGDLLVSEIIGPKAGGSLGLFEEWILAPGTYLARLTNTAPQAQAAALQFDFYDGSRVVL